MPPNLNLKQLFARAILRGRSEIDSLRSTLRSFCYCEIMKHCGPGFSPGPGFTVASPDHISAGEHLATGRNVRLHAWPEYASKRNCELGEVLVRIGHNVFINDASYISAACRIDIGDNCLIGSNVLINDNSHGETSLVTRPRSCEPLSIKGPISIGRNVWICNNVVITSGVSIGDNSIIAANSVVTKSFPPGSLIAGTPAKMVRRLHSS